MSDPSFGPFVDDVIPSSPYTDEGLAMPYDEAENAYSRLQEAEEDRIIAEAVRRLPNGGVIGRTRNGDGYYAYDGRSGEGPGADSLLELAQLILNDEQRFPKGE